ncbi:hypothetical protein [Streptomyces sp. AC550_RSS872]|uniref:hypothetical protein n=1 Tax=Streptomyces sp. AC550_RSS872 TaxID=2823689 RepID=UPI001C27174A|nr:hypothetical protein [Streptomyces sp. AC550_RSS872]
MIQRLTPFIKWAALLTILAEILLVWTGKVSFTDAAIVVVIIEGLLLCLLLLGAWQIRNIYREQRDTAPDRFTAAMRAVEEVLPKPLGKLIAFELTLQRSTLLLATRRRDVPKGGTGVPYYRALSGILWVMLAVTIVEIVVVHLAIPWPTVRIILLVVSVIGLWWLVAFFASLVAYPTTLHNGKLRIRFSDMVDVTVPLEGVERVRLHRQSRSQRRIAMFADDALYVEVYGSTNVAIRLREPVLISLPKEGERFVSEVHLWADDPDRLLALLTEAAYDK